jgi:hypothetical protein
MRRLWRNDAANQAAVAVALGLLLALAGNSPLAAQPAPQPALDRASGVRFMLFRGAFGEVCQAQFGNVALHFDVSAVVAPPPPVQVDEVFATVQPPPRSRVNLVQGSADEFVYGFDANAAGVTRRLEQTFRRRLTAIDDLCRLTAVQRDKLSLAGSGDIQRHLSRAGLLRQKFEACPDLADVSDFRAWCKQLSQEARLLDQALMCGIFGSDSLLTKTMRATLTADQWKELKELNAVLVASTNPAAVASVPARPGLRSDDPANLERVLKEWYQAASRIERLDCNFVRMKYDTVFEVEFRSIGTLAIDRTGSALYRLDRDPSAQGKISRKIGRSGLPYELQDDTPERWYWTRDRVLQINDSDHTYEVATNPRVTPDGEFRPDPPELPQELENGGRGAQPSGPPNWLIDFSASLDEPRFGCLQPFLLGLAPEEIQRRFTIRFLSETDAEVRLEFTPRDRRDKVNFSSLQLILSKGGYKPYAIKTVGPSGSETVHVFTDVVLKINNNRQPLAPPGLAGYRQLNHDRPAASPKQPATP